MKSRPIKLINKTQHIRISQKHPRILVKQVGGRGKAGKDGEDGVGLPIGGLPGQTLFKVGTSDYETEWGDVGGADKHFMQSFSLASSVVVNHNLSKYPSVTVQDSSGSEVEGDISHTSINSLTVSFSAQFSGVVTCN